MDDNAFQQAQAAHEEETEYYLGFDPGCVGEEAVCLVRVREGEVEEVNYLPGPIATFVNQEEIDNWLEAPSGRFRALYLAVKSGLRNFRDALRRSHN